MTVLFLQWLSNSEGFCGAYRSHKKAEFVLFVGFDTPFDKLRATQPTRASFGKLSCG